MFYNAVKYVLGIDFRLSRILPHSKEKEKVDRLLLLTILVHPHKIIRQHVLFGDSMLFSTMDDGRWQRQSATWMTQSTLPGCPLPLR